MRIIFFYVFGLPFFFNVNFCIFFIFCSYLIIKIATTDSANDTNKKGPRNSSDQFLVKWHSIKRIY